ncbi:MAG: hypothetical protein KJ023_15560 [Burkholderiaceae bacterium]|nr:hypothetical protein [Burkholderiaceae bacterium]
MCHAFLSSSSFWSLLVRIDQDLAAEVRSAGCPACGGVLHSAHYPRKPRGVVRSVLGQAYERRLSFCCDRDGCRRRSTPVSVRFLGRRVFLGAVVVLVTALAHGLNGRRAAALCAQFHVSVRTLRRWRQWWLRAFVASATWSAVRARLATPVAIARLPAALLEHCTGADEATRLTQLLRLLAPLSTRASVRDAV